MQKPRRIDPLAEKVLMLLSSKPPAGEVVLGGYFALQHYADYRSTHDIDAWWKTRADPAAEQVIRDAMSEVAAAEGFKLVERRFGETISFELVREGKRRFSFQIAVRSVQLEPPVQSAWPPILIETLSDNIGSKMNALVDRGTPRDFTDIRHLVQAQLTTPQRCWQLWQAKNRNGATDAAKQKMLLHLSALEARRPLEKIADEKERQRAGDVRRWFRDEFLK